jgi:hypothetical protein
MTTARNARVLWVMPLLIVVCFVSIPSEAETSRYRFLSEQSTLVQSGGIAGLHRTYTITGTFELMADFEAGTALFSHVDASAVCSIPSRTGRTEHYDLDPNEVFNMTSLAGTIVDGDESIRFDGTADDRSSIRIMLTYVDGSVSLKGETVPPPSSADFFIYTVDALAEPKYEYSGGTGEPNDPYQIATAEDLMLLGESPEDNGKHFILTADIDLDPNLPGRKVFDRAVIGPYTYDVAEGWQGMPFTGVFDGNGKKIYNFSYTSTDRNYVGLFGFVDDPNAQIINLGLVNPDIEAGTGEFVGSLVGLLKTGRIVGCYVEDGSVSGKSIIGGLIGENTGTVDGCYSTCNVTGEEEIGGLIGENAGTVDGCYSTCNVTGERVVGGLVGQNGFIFGWSMIMYSGTISNCYSTGSTSGNESVGGLVGLYYVGIITNCYATGKVLGNEYVGGLVGTEVFGLGEVEACFWDIETSGQTNSAGGIGKTTTEIQTANTFLEAGWDFVDETANGTEDIWRISDGSDYPRLWWEKYSGGTGETNNPYRIATVEDLMLLGESPEDYDKHFILTADIDLDPDLPGRKIFDRAIIAADMNDATWSFEGTPFTGVFDGNGHMISRLTITGGWYLGLFGKIYSGAKISNLVLEAMDVSGTGDYVGGLAGRNEGSINTSYSTGRVSGERNVGGLVGNNSFGSIATSYSTCAVNGTSAVGGLVGGHGGGDATVGGILINCYSTGMVDGEGGVGGLVGRNGGIIAMSHSTGTVNGTGACTGGLVGDDYGIITTSYSSGVVAGNRFVGGLVGMSYGQIAASYSTGTVSGNEDVGGLAGNNFYGPITTSFWDIETSGQTTSAGGTGKTTAEMQTESTFTDAGWDFAGEILNGICDYWQISPGDYPRLRYPVMPEGLGTAEEPYLIRDARDLGTVWLEPLAHYRLKASVDLSGMTWSMAVVTWFGGTFDGSGYVISNLSIQGGRYLGLFGHLGSQAKISNLGLETVDVNGITDVGGLVGNNQGGSISTCYSNGTVNGTGSRVGVLVGENYGSITNSHSTGMVTGFGAVGGLVGGNYEGSIATSYSTSITSGTWRSVGGLVGDNSGSITTSYSTGTVTGTGEDVGGLVGSNLSSVTMCHSTGTVSGDWGVGGLVGYDEGSVAMSYSTGSVSGDRAVGGLVGASGGIINNSYSTGTVSGISAVGGLVGHGSTVVKSYSTGTVSGNEYVGGLVGGFGGSVYNSFWDIETSRQITSAGGTAKTTAEMQTADTFLEVGWDFMDETENGTEDIWWIDEGQDYPRLWWELVPEN